MTLNRNLPLTALFYFTIFFFLSIASAGGAAQLRFSHEKMENSDSVTLEIDHAEKLAGLKVALEYDARLLLFVKATKSSATSSFLHVVNDKKPGRLVVVMASARGITGDRVPLFSLDFTRTGSEGTVKPELSVTQLQLMTEDLKEIVGNHPSFLFP